MLGLDDDDDDDDDGPDSLIIQLREMASSLSGGIDVSKEEASTPSPNHTPSPHPTLSPNHTSSPQIRSPTVLRTLSSSSLIPSPQLQTTLLTEVSSSSSLSSMDHEFEEDQVEHLVNHHEDQHDDQPLMQKSVSTSVPILHDLSSILLLILLYTIQGVPLGLTFGSVPFMLQSSSSYTDIGIFSFASYPYSLKLFWSPVVDSVYSIDIGLGRRKSWIIPIQLLVGLILVAFCDTIENYVTGATSNSHEQNIRILTILFFVIVLLVATQDIAVDGWALTMLSKSNRGLASTCQSIGQNIGFFMSYTIFLALSSASFCNKWLRATPSPEGITSLSSYIRFWGWVMTISTLMIWALKTEKRAKTKKTLKSVYEAIWKIIQLPAMQSLLVILLTSKLAFSGADNVTVLKLVEKGFPRETMALMVFISFPFDVILPVIISRWVRKEGNAPLHAYLIAYPVRILMTLVGAMLVYIFPANPEDHSFALYAMAFIVQVLYSFTSNTMFVALCTFFAEIADVKIGGTYMTLLNTVTNLGGTWPKFFVLYLVDWFTVKSCVPDSTCTVVRDGYYTICFLCATFGLIWWSVMSSKINIIQNMDKSEWRIQTEKNE